MVRTTGKNGRPRRRHPRRRSRRHAELPDQELRSPKRRGQGRRQARGKEIRQRRRLACVRGHSCPREISQHRECEDYCYRLLESRASSPGHSAPNRKSNALSDPTSEVTIRTALPLTLRKTTLSV